MSYRLRDQKWQLHSPSGQHRLLDLVRDQTRPFYVYDLADALERADQLTGTGLSVHYAMKANSNPRLLRELAKRGLGVDVVSLGEMQKALSHGFRPGHVIFSGVAKDREELEFALAQNIFQINCESFEELQLLNAVALERGVVAPVALRLNIHLSAPTHAHVQTATPDSKFGIELGQLGEILTWLKGSRGLKLQCLATHIGSQILDLSAFEKMARQMGQLYREVKTQGFDLRHLDLGGGLGIDYHDTGEGDLERAQKYLETLQRAHDTDARVFIEPGRFLVARMGVLMARVIYVKSTSRQKFLVLNVGMNALMRPALYQAYHRIEPIEPRAERETYTVVGPICESTDQFAVAREMPRVQRGDWVAILDVGAYGAVMANTYNETPLPREWSWLEGRWEVL